MTLIFQAVFMNAHAGNRLLYESFDSQVLDSRIMVIGHNWANLKPPQYNLDAVGVNGTGHCFSSGTTNEAYLHWVNQIPKPWPSDEMFVSYWMRYPKFILTDPTNENLKIFYPRWDNATSYVHYAFAQPDTVYYSAMAQGTMVAYSRWLNCPGMTDGKWHRYEFYVKFSGGVSKFWYDGTLLVDDAYGPDKWTNSMYYISAPSIDAEDPGVFSRQVDELEVWDGLP